MSDNLIKNPNFSFPQMEENGGIMLPFYFQLNPNPTMDELFKWSTILSTFMFILNGTETIEQGLPSMTLLSPSQPQALIINTRFLKQKREYINLLL